MPALALSDALPDFGSAPRLVARAGAGELAGGQGAQAPEPALPDPELIRAEVAKAEAALGERLAQEHEAALAAVEERHADEIARLRTQFGEEAAQRLGEKMAELEEKLVALTSAATARMLSVVLTEDVQKRAVEQLGLTIADTLADREAVKIKVRGPASLYEALAPALGKRADNVEFSESGGLDLTVEIDEGVFETRLSEWSAALSEVLA